MRVILALLIFGTSSLLLDSCAANQKAQSADAAKPTEAPAVAVVKAGIEDISRSMVLTAEFKPYQEIDVMAKVSGYIKDIDVDVGDRVKQGQLLAVLEVPEMTDDTTRAQSMLNRSQADVARAKDEVRRAESAQQIAHLSSTRLSDVAKQKAGLVAQQEVDDASSKDLVAQAQTSAAKSSLSVAEEQVQVSMAELQKTKTLLDYTRVTAPFEGVITKRYADKGSMIQAGTSSSTQAMPVVKLSENGRLRLILPVPESAVPSIHVGQDVEVNVPTLGRSFPGRVARFSDKVLPATRTMDAEVDVMNPSLILIPGMYAEVTITLEKHGGVITAPISAVTIGGDESSGQLVVITPANRVEFRTVQLGLQNANNVEIRTGLHEGDLVVIGNRAGLRDGDQVRPRITNMEAATAP